MFLFSLIINILLIRNAQEEDVTKDHKKTIGSF
jgi:hypothetical protein